MRRDETGQAAETLRKRRTAGSIRSLSEAVSALSRASRLLDLSCELGGFSDRFPAGLAHLVLQNVQSHPFWHSQMLGSDRKRCLTRAGLTLAPFGDCTGQSSSCIFLLRHVCCRLQNETREVEEKGSSQRLRWEMARGPTKKD